MAKDDNNNTYNNNPDQHLSDAEALGTFQLDKVIEYYNAASQKAPSDIAGEDRAIADMLEQVLAEAARLDATGSELTADDTALIKQEYAWDVKVQSSGEAEQIEDYEASKIAEFVAAKPEIWKRLSAQDGNEFVARAKKYLQPGA